MPIKQGWNGRTYEDFEVGDVYVHPLGRTVLAVDNSWFTLLTQNTNPIHFDVAYAAQTEFKRPLVDSTFTLALVTGQSVDDLSRNAIANLGWDEVRLPNPLFNAGIVRVKTIGFTQVGTIVIEFKRTIMVWKRGHVPTSHMPTPKTPTEP